ncbi:hypothetical protein PVAP13_1NG142619 [Panicum virgatum]|uniref:Uncharacterized protein n=1 Tax=Panicum virgatum TaxID=38727 RepID=A0A8T0X362_PANVG|nr:hypothetical protein PVAP13_1NG142619 [Panicum virgatum]
MVVYHRRLPLEPTVMAIFFPLSSFFPPPYPLASLLYLPLRSVFPLSHLPDLLSLSRLLLPPSPLFPSHSSLLPSSSTTAAHPGSWRARLRWPACGESPLLLPLFRCTETVVGPVAWGRGGRQAVTATVPSAWENRPLFSLLPSHGRIGAVGTAGRHMAAAAGVRGSCPPLLSSSSARE